MKTAALVLALLIFCSPNSVIGGQPKNINTFLYLAPIKGPLKKGMLYQAPLNENILSKCNRDCIDARIFDQDRKEISFVMIESRGSNALVEKYPFEITAYDETPDGDIIIMKLPEKHRAINAVQISTRNTDFRKKVWICGSADMKKWDLLAEDGIWDFSSQVDLRKTEIKFPESDYRYYRLVFKDLKKQNIKSENVRLKYQGGTNYREIDFSVENGKTGRIHIDAIEGSAGISGLKAVHDEMTARFSSRKDKDHTVIDIEAGIPFERVSFDIANLYYLRKVGIYYSDTGKEGSFRLTTTAQIYSFPFSDSMQTKNYIASPGSGKGYYRFVIENRNNPPLEIGSVKLQWVRRNLFFIALGDSSQYTLWFGNSELRKPDYDIVHFINQCNWYTHSAEELRIGQVKRNITFISVSDKEGQASIEKTILTIIVILLVSIIGYWLYSLVKNANFKRKGNDS